MGRDVFINFLRWPPCRKHTADHVEFALGLSVRVCFRRNFIIYYYCYDCAHTRRPLSCSRHRHRRTHILTPRFPAKRPGPYGYVPPRDRFENETCRIFDFFVAPLNCMKNIAPIRLSSGRSILFRRRIDIFCVLRKPVLHSSRVKARTRVAADLQLVLSFPAHVLAAVGEPEFPLRTYLHLPLSPRTITVGDHGEDVVVPTSDDGCDQSCRCLSPRQDLFVCKCRVFTRDGQQQ